jgi:hypothetical protein
MIDEFSYTNCAAANSSTGGSTGIMEALSIFRLMECNPFVKKLKIEENNTNCPVDDGIFSFLSKHCQELREIELLTALTEAIRLALALFPNLSYIS